IWFQPLKAPDKEYTLKDYFLKKELTRQDVDGMLDDYYDEHGWNPTTSHPTEKKLKELGLGNLVS
ncbi:MAG: hypothetical protein FJZ94_05665, partial [Chloroflexi bacterium]|nr:hypothetical protein [Chloroflexota bacterium]